MATIFFIAIGNLVPHIFGCQHFRLYIFVRGLYEGERMPIFQLPATVLTERKHSVIYRRNLIGLILISDEVREKRARFLRSSGKKVHLESRELEGGRRAFLDLEEKKRNGPKNVSCRAFFSVSPSFFCGFFSLFRSIKQQLQRTRFNRWPQGSS